MAAPEMYTRGQPGDQDNRGESLVSSSSSSGRQQQWQCRMQLHQQHQHNTMPQAYMQLVILLHRAPAALWMKLLGALVWR